MGSEAIRDVERTFMARLTQGVINLHCQLIFAHFGYSSSDTGSNTLVITVICEKIMCGIEMHRGRA